MRIVFGNKKNCFFVMTSVRRIGRKINFKTKFGRYKENK